MKGKTAVQDVELGNACPASLAEATARSQAEAPEASACNQGLIVNMAEQLRRWSGGIIGAAADPGATIQLLESFVAHLDKCAVAMTADSFSTWSWDGTGRG